MSELKVDPQTLETSASRTRTAYDSASQVNNLQTIMSGVSTAVPGGTCGGSASSAGSFTDTVAKQNSDGLEAYETALRDAQNNYSGTDESTAISFDKFHSVIDAKE